MSKSAFLANLVVQSVGNLFPVIPKIGASLAISFSYFSLSLTILIIPLPPSFFFKPFQ